jgi:Protein of unknown function (DUF2735)
MPSIYTGDEFVLIMLHQQRARTIWISVTNRERVGRSIRHRAPAKGDIEMNTSLNHGSATIYQFPAGGRAALAGRRYEAAHAVSDFASPRANAAGYGGNWYHEAAIEESKSGDEH